MVILKPFINMVKLEDEQFSIKFNPEIFEMHIDYRFVSNLGETFEAELWMGESEG